MEGAWTKAAPLALGLCAACGSGISPDPTSRALGARGDAGSDRTSIDDSSPGARDVTGADDELDDSTTDQAEDGGGDVSSDASGARPADGGADRDVANDVVDDRAADTSLDRSAPNDAAEDERDVAPGATDAPLDAMVDSGARDVDTSDACPVGCVPDELYVDAAAAPGGDGSRANPFRTISTAIEAHGQEPGRARTVHVAAGTYDEALGEQFPLVLRGLSVQGAGQDQTVILGSGMLDHAAEGGPKRLRYMVTIAIGDRSLPTTLSGVSVLPTVPVPTRGYYGIFCDRGNATGEVPSPGGLTHLDQVSVGPAFDTNVMVVTSTAPAVTGCNMLVTRSTLTGGWCGVEAVGCDGAVTPVPVMLEMGTADPGSGNTITWFRGPSGNGVLTNGCAIRASFQYNSFADDNVGLRIVEDTLGPNPGGPSHPFVIKHNTFERAASAGIDDFATLVFIDEISDNQFFQTTLAQRSYGERAMGLRIASPNVGKVRRNVFGGNDVGVQLDPGAQSTDFGRPDDPGGNVFYCNSGTDDWYGADVVFSHAVCPPCLGLLSSDGGADGGSATLIPFAGNAWDHEPPRVEALDVGTNGVEISLDQTPSLVFDLSQSSVVTTACPPGRTR